MTTMKMMVTDEIIQLPSVFLSNGVSSLKVRTRCECSPIRLIDSGDILHHDDTNSNRENERWLKRKKTKHQ